MLILPTVCFHTIKWITHFSRRQQIFRLLIFDLCTHLFQELDLNTGKGEMKNMYLESDKVMERGGDEG